MYRCWIVVVCLVISACGGGGGASSDRSTPSAPTAPPSRVSVQVGCYNAAYQNVQRSVLGCGLLNSFGVQAFDDAFARESEGQDRFFQKVVLVAAFDECTGVKNALSHPSGFILFGRNLAFDVVLSTFSTSGVAGILAHEYAHQKQFDFGWMRPWDSTVRTTELEADAFSGLYMGLEKGFGTSVVRGYFETLANVGDYNFNHPSHHGTPTNRVAAGLLGLTVADDIMRSGSSPSWEQLHNFFVGFILSAQSQQALTSGAADTLLRTPEGRENLRIVSQGGIPDIPSRGPDSASRRHLYPR